MVVEPIRSPAFPRTVPRRQVLVDGVYEAIKGLIMDHVIEPGGRVNIDGLARDLQVSPTPVREALARLESDGLVSKQPLVGYSAEPLLDAAGLDQLYEMRLVLEPVAARWAAESISSEQLRDLTSVLSEMESAVGAKHGEGYGAYRAFAQQDSVFHEIVANASGRPLMAQTLARLHPHTQLYRLFFSSAVEQQTVSEHDRIVRALRSQDADAASAAMNDHLTRAHERLRAAVLEAEQAMA